MVRVRIRTRVRVRVKAGARARVRIRVRIRVRVAVRVLGVLGHRQARLPVSGRGGLPPPHAGIFRVGVRVEGLGFRV